MMHILFFLVFPRPSIKYGIKVSYLNLIKGASRVMYSYLQTTHLYLIVLMTVQNQTVIFVEIWKQLKDGVYYGKYLLMPTKPGT